MRCKNEHAYCENRSHNALVALHRGAVARSCCSYAVGVAVVTRPRLPGLAPGFATKVAVSHPTMLGIEGAALIAPWEALHPASKFKARSPSIPGPYFRSHSERHPSGANRRLALGISASPAGALLFPHFFEGEASCPKCSTPRCSTVQPVLCLAASMASTIQSFTLRFSPTVGKAALRRLVVHR